jgi:hypothetical protein
LEINGLFGRPDQVQARYQRIVAMLEEGYIMVLTLAWPGQRLFH